MGSCPVCGEDVPVRNGRGRPRRYCSRACQARAYRARSGHPAPAAGTPTAGGPVPLSLARIVDAAIAVADRDGLEALHMRALAAELGAGTMSLYRHVPGRDALVDAMVERVLTDEPLPEDPAPGWRASLERLAWRDWEMYARHPWILRHAGAGSRIRWSAAAAADAERSLAAFDGPAIPPRERLRLLYVVSAFTQGLALARANEEEAARRTGVSGEQWWRAQRPDAEAALADGAFPRLTALLGTAPPPVSARFTELFADGLATVLDGIAVSLGERPGSGAPAAAGAGARRSRRGAGRGPAPATG